ncbi:MAG: restriction endonuclease subunit S [Capnocytophaga felis]|nr:restriction endonuclease subunit S [Capnocytophaga felis]
MSKLQPYPKYKPIAYDYVSQLPEGWELLPNIAIFQERKEKGGLEMDSLSVSAIKGIVKMADYEDRKDRTSDDKSEYLIVRCGDIPYNTMLMWAGAVGRSEYEGIVSPAYTVLKPKMEINTKYFHYMFRTAFYTNYSKRFSYGIVDSRLRLYYTYFKRMYSIVPPLAEQNAIVAFLDQKTEQIQNFITKKQKLIQLLEEKKRAVINKAITQGIDKNIEYKETNIGLIPKTWKIKRLGVLGNFYKGGNISRQELTTSFASDNDVSAILYGDIYTKYNIEAIDIVNKISKETSKKSVRLEKGDLLFTGSGETKEDIGKCVLFNSDLETFAGGDVIIFKQKKVDALFLSYSQNSDLARHQKTLSAKGEIIIHTYGSSLRNVYMPFPPSIEEQKKICQFIKNECSKIDHSISIAQLEIEKLKEYQESLITQVVTGQLQVPVA